MDEKKKESWRDQLDDQQSEIVANCIKYALGPPAGRGNPLMLTIATMATLLDGVEAAQLGACGVAPGVDILGYTETVRCCVERARTE
jgi:hypothetical protein